MKKAQTTIEGDAGVSEEAPTTTTETMTIAAPDPKDLGPDGMKGLTVEQRKAVNHLRAKEGFPIGELERPAPKKPKLTSGAGDKEPEYVRWLLRYHPARFVTTYGVVGLGEKEVPEVFTDNEGKKRKRKVRRGGFVIARRNTILTVTRDAGDAADVQEDNE